MRAICCALIAYVLHTYAVKMNRKHEKAESLGGWIMLISLLFLVLSVILMIFGL